MTCHFLIVLHIQGHTYMNQDCENTIPLFSLCILTLMIIYELFLLQLNS